MGISIDGDDFDPKTLGFDGHFFAELARAQQHEARCAARTGCADGGRHHVPRVTLERSLTV